MAEANEKKANATGRSDEHVDQSSGARVPTPDPKDQTGDPEADNPAMRELHERQKRGASHEA
jgi:hypothetical protein